MGCVLENRSVGFVPPEGPRDAKLLVISEHCGEMDARFSRPLFPVKAGQMFTDWLYEAGWQRTQTLITSLIWCWLPGTTKNGVSSGSGKIPWEAVRYCTERHLGPLLEQTIADVIVLAVDSQKDRPSLLAKYMEITDVNKRIGTFERRAAWTAGPSNGTPADADDYSSSEPGATPSECGSSPVSDLPGDAGTA